MSIIFVVMLLLGFLSLHACDARTIGAVVRHKETDEKLKPVARRANVEQDEAKRWVRWRVPHQKKGDAEPGLNLDYLPPKTHPPVHN